MKKWDNSLQKMKLYDRFHSSIVQVSSLMVEFHGDFETFSMPNNKICGIG